MLPLSARNYDALNREFQWNLPDRYNIGVDVCTRWATTDPDRTALLYLDGYGDTHRYTFEQIHALSNQLAHVFRSYDVRAGDRVGVLLPQAPETAIAHVAAFKAGCISIPLFTLFGEEALRFRLSDSGARVVVTNRQGAARLAAIRAHLPALKVVLTIDGTADGSVDMAAGMARFSTEFCAHDTSCDDPAVIIYTSGTTGNPKGALHAHRVLPGHLPGVEMSHNGLPHEGDRFWTPADWAWIGGLFDVLMSAWHHGIAVVAHRFEKFSAAAAFQLMQDFQVRNTFLPPTALKLMRAEPDPGSRWRLALRSVASGGESLGAELLSWGEQTFGLTINEFYGQTECNMTVSSCAGLAPPKAGVIGRPVIGHCVAVVDDSGNELPRGELGQIAVRQPDPVMFLGYWGNPQATADKFVNDWLLTGDTGRMDSEGYVQFVGRNDDVITSAGYRIGPGEIEDSLLRHPAVKMVAVIGAPDPERTEVVVAVIVLHEHFQASDTLKKELQNHVKRHLAAHEYPREIYFVPELPLTTTGKIIRRELRDHVIGWRAC
jgi:acetyl-CoA synthetase